eukprot:ctg_858.g376
MSFIRPLLSVASPVHALPCSSGRWRRAAARQNGLWTGTAGVVARLLGGLQNRLDDGAESVACVEQIPESIYLWERMRIIAATPEVEHEGTSWLGVDRCRPDLDVNSRSTGYALVSSASTQPLALARGCVQMARDADLYNKAQQIGRTVYDDVLRATADAPTIPLVIGVEAYMRQYAGGRFRTQALFRQAELNTLAAYELSRLFRTGCVPLQVHPNEARAWWGISRLAEGDMSGSQRAKQLMLHRVARYVMPPPTGGSNEIDSSLSTAVSHDVTDAFVVAHYTMVLEQEARAMADVPDDEYRERRRSFMAPLAKASKRRGGIDRRRGSSSVLGTAHPRRPRLRSSLARANRGRAAPVGASTSPHAMGCVTGVGAEPGSVESRFCSSFAAPAGQFSRHFCQHEQVRFCGARTGASPESDVL